MASSQDIIKIKTWTNGSDFPIKSLLAKFLQLMASCTFCTRFGSIPCNGTKPPKKKNQRIIAQQKSDSKDKPFPKKKKKEKDLLWAAMFQDVEITEEMRLIFILVGHAVIMKALVLIGFSDFFF